MKSQHGPTGGPIRMRAAPVRRVGLNPRQTGRSGDNVVDAEFEVLDDDKNKGKQP